MYEGRTNLRNEPFDFRRWRQHLGGYFANWITGETDFEVMEWHSEVRIVDKRGLILNDSTFSAALDEFFAALGT